LFKLILFFLIYINAISKTKNYFIKSYRFDIWNNVEKLMYDAMCKWLTRMWYKVFYTRQNHTTTHAKMQKRESKRRWCGRVRISKPETFDNQFISWVWRLHQWEEFVFDNKDIKEWCFIVKMWL